MKVKVLSCSGGVADVEDTHCFVHCDRTGLNGERRGIHNSHEAAGRGDISVNIAVVPVQGVALCVCVTHSHSVLCNMLMCTVCDLLV